MIAHFEARRTVLVLEAARAVVVVHAVAVEPARPRVEAPGGVRGRVMDVKLVGLVRPQHAQHEAVPALLVVEGELEVVAAASHGSASERERQPGGAGARGRAGKRPPRHHRVLGPDACPRARPLPMLDGAAL